MRVGDGDGGLRAHGLVGGDEQASLSSSGTENGSISHGPLHVPTAGATGASCTGGPATIADARAIATACRAVRRGRVGGHFARRREAPGAVGEDAHAQAEAVGALDLLDATGRNLQLLARRVDDARVGVVAPAKRAASSAASMMLLQRAPRASYASVVAASTARALPPE